MSTLNEKNQNEDSLFDSATPVVDDDKDHGSLEPVDVDAVEEDDTPTEYESSEMPAELVLSRKESLNKLIRYAMHVAENADTEALYYNKSELAKEADTSRHSIHKYIEIAVDLGVYHKRGDGVEKFRPNTDSLVLRGLKGFNDAVQQKMNENNVDQTIRSN